MTAIRLQELTAAWSAWADRTAVDVLESITHVQLNARRGGYSIHIHALDADQIVVDHLAAALGCPSNEGWEPRGGSRTERQWMLEVIRGGVDFHVTATRNKPDDQEGDDE